MIARKLVLTLLLNVFIGEMVFVGSAVADNSFYRGWLEITDADAVLKVSSYCSGLMGSRLEYELKTYKSSLSGNTVATQKGDCNLDEQTSRLISTISFNKEHNATYKFSLKLFLNKKLVSEDHYP